jgi:hypothetical protein
MTKILLISAACALVGGAAMASTSFDGCILGACGYNSSVGCTATTFACDATNESLAADLIASFFGTTYEQQQSAAGQLVMQNKGYLTLVNNFLLILKEHVTAATGPDGLTFTGTGGGTMHAVVTQAVTVNSVAYDFEAKVWDCQGSCSAASAFAPKFYLAWTVSDDGTVNKGTGAFQWASGAGGMSLVYDVGSSTTKQFITADFYDAAGGGSPLPTRFDATKTGTVYDVTEIDARDNQRWAATVDSSTNSGALSVEGLQCGTTGCISGGSTTLQSSATNDTPTQWGCFTRVATTKDFSYTPTGSQTGCTLTAKFPAVSFDTFKAAVTSTATATGALFGGSPFNGMTANPPNI